MAPNAEAAEAGMEVEICYATPSLQVLLTLRVMPLTSVGAAIRQSRILIEYPEIDLSTQKVGVFGKIRELDDVLVPHDRIEIYRPLIVDPKIARARRVAKARKSGSTEGRKWANRIYR